MTPKSRLIKKVKVWSDAVALKKLREYILNRDKRCVFCKRNNVILDVSHYWGRYKSAVRYNFLNCDLVCRGCHYKHENSKQGFYRRWKIKQLGEKGYKDLEKVYYQSKMTRREAILELMKLLKP